MELKIFTVYDSKANAYMQPFFMNSTGQALRAWIDAVNDKTTQFNKHPEDFTLFEIGVYHDENAQIESLRTPISIGVALELVNKGETI